MNKSTATHSNFSLSKRLHFSVLMMMILVCSSLQAQYKSLIPVKTNETMLLLGIGNNNKLYQLTFGSAQSDTSTFSLGLLKNSEAYTSYGTNIDNPSLYVKHADDNSTSNLVYKSHRTIQNDPNSTTTIVELADSHYPLVLKLYYKTYAKENIIEQWAELSHSEKGNITIFNLPSANLFSSSKQHYVTYFNGDWGNEFNPYETKLQPGSFVLDSKAGVRTTQKTNPSFLLSINGKLQENSGAVIGGTLAWPGNWQLAFNVDNQHKLQIAPGINPYASQYVLAPNKTFKTPSFIYTYSANGAGDVTRRFHDWARNYGIHNGNADRDVILNNWEATGTNFNEERIVGLIQEGGNLGFDLFLLDDGWFGDKYPRNSDDAGLGDWIVNPKKLPNGVQYLADQANKNKVKFGIWVEPEMVNPNSELYKKHPDWVIAASNRDLDLQRNQAILDLSNPKVQDYIFQSLEKLVAENPGIQYIKWDCNRFMTNPASNYLPKDKQANLYVDYANGYLAVLERFRNRFPDITLMQCASGGGRMDYGSMKYYDEYWPSDNTSPADRIKIQWGTSYFFPMLGMASHISEMGDGYSLKFRLDVAMSAKLGTDLDLNKLHDHEKVQVKNAIADYKQIKDIIFHGDMYRLVSPYQEPRAVLQYLQKNKDKAVVFSFQTEQVSGGDHTPFKLQGLDPNAQYKIQEINKTNYSRLYEYDGKVFTGKFLMDEGFKFSMWNQNESTAFIIEKQ